MTPELQLTIIKLMMFWMFGIIVIVSLVEAIKQNSKRKFENSLERRIKRFKV